MVKLAGETERPGDLPGPYSQCGHTQYLSPFSLPLLAILKKGGLPCFIGTRRSEDLTLNKFDNELSDHEETKDNFGCLPSAAS